LKKRTKKLLLVSCRAFSRRHREPPLGGVAIQGYAKNATSAVTISCLKSELNRYDPPETSKSFLVLFSKKNCFLAAWLSHVEHGAYRHILVRLMPKARPIAATPTRFQRLSTQNRWHRSYSHPHSTSPLGGGFHFRGLMIGK
jgi:hypothetical protein